MIKKIYLPILTAGLLLSNPLLAQSEKSKIALSNSVKKEYTQALSYFKAKEYQKSYEAFDALFQDNLDHVLINYYLGRSAFELGQYEFAISAYDRILIQDSSNNRVRLELAQSYLQMGLWAQALEEFNTVSQGKLPVHIRQRVEKTIDLLKNKQKKSQFSTYAMASILYDSNINNAAIIGNFNIYSPDLGRELTVSSADKEESTMIYQTVLNFNYKYKIEDDIIWDNNASFMNMVYDDYKDKNIQVYSFASRPTFYNKKNKSSIALLVDKVFLGNKPYQLNYYINTDYTESITENLINTMSLKLGRINYRDNSAKDAKVVEYSNFLKYLSDDYGLFTFAFTSGKEIEVMSERTDITYNYYNIYLGNSTEIFTNYTLLTSFNYKGSNYKDVDVNFQSTRQDRKRDFSVSLEKQISNNVVLNVGSTLTERKSNHESSNFDKYVIKAGMFMSF